MEKRENQSFQASNEGVLTRKLADEIDLDELWHAITSRWKKIALITGVFMLGSIIYVLNQPNWYRSEALLAAATDGNSDNALSGLTSQFGGLASLAGINLGNNGNRIEETLAVLQSREFITEFVRENNLLVPLFALQPVMFGKGKVAINDKVYNETTKEWVRHTEPPFTKEPTDWEIYKEFMLILSVDEDADSGLITVAIEWYDPEQAQQWVTLLIEKANAYMRKRDVDEANKSIGFINQKVQEVSLSHIKTVFYGLIEAHLKTIVLAEVRDEYTFRTIDKAVVPLERVRPKRALICILATFFGTILGVIWSLLAHYVLPARQ